MVQKWESFFTLSSARYCFDLIGESEHTLDTVESLKQARQSPLGCLAR
jgi:hypothetical protein